MHILKSFYSLWARLSWHKQGGQFYVDATVEESISLELLISADGKDGPQQCLYCQGCSLSQGDTESFLESSEDI